MREAEPLVAKYGDDEKATALAAARSIEQRAATNQEPSDAGRKPLEDAGGATARRTAFDPEQLVAPHDLELGPNAPAAKQRATIRDDVYRVISELKRVEDVRTVPKSDKEQATQLSKQLGKSVEYAPDWVRLLSAICLGVGTMIGYRRIVTTLGERLGNTHLTPAQGAAAEVVSSVLIGTAGFTGLPVSTTHIVTSGIGGTMVSAGAGLRFSMIRRVLSAWLLTLPVTILTAGVLYYFLANPRL
jgi:PiT family inorganic phosphate transporter